MEDNPPLKNHRFFTHTDCEYFPCHPTDLPERFNCLFCYCPLYVLGEQCGGNFRYTERGIKDCSGCMLPHRAENYDYVIGKYPEIIKITQKTHRASKNG